MRGVMFVNLFLCMHVRVLGNSNEGLFILNLHDGRKQEFKPIHFNLHSPSEHTVNGRHYDAELQILHHYKGTENQLGAVIGIFFTVKPGQEDNQSAFLQSVFDIIDGPDTTYSSGQVRMLDFL